MQGKTFDTSSLEGRRLWNAVSERLHNAKGAAADDVAAVAAAAEEPARYGADYLAKTRLGQGAFQVLVTDAYQRRCAITGERTLPVLEAAHIRPFSQQGPNAVQNGLLLRSDMHILFDRGYVTVTEDHHVLVSKNIREEFENGREYYAFDGKALRSAPERQGELPSKEFLQWHNHNVFQA